MGQAGDRAAPAPIIDELSGRWEGTGVLLGRPAVFEMSWRPLDDGFVRLSFTNAWVDEQGRRTPVLAAEAVYLFEGDGGVGVWLDDRPRQLTSRATVTDSSLVVHWRAEDEEGWTEYRIESDGTIAVTDTVLVDGEERTFGVATYRRSR